MRLHREGSKKKIPRRNKRGSTAVFLSIILSSLIMLSLAMIWSAREHSVNSMGDGLMELAVDSVMSEFHREVYTGYGLFMLKSDGSEMSSAFRGYMSPSLSAMKDVALTDAESEGSRYAIVDPEPVRLQIIAYMKSGGADFITGRDKDAPGSGGYHNLNHGPTIVSLPSRQLPDKSLMDYIGNTDRLNDLSSVFTSGTDRFLLGSYVLGTFNNCAGTVDPEHFFRNEAEYILFGKLTDEENEKAVTNVLKALRFPSNLAHIYSDEAKSLALAAAAEAVSPGPLGIALKAVIAGAWAWAEAANDVALLMDGYRVPAVKTPSTWALDIDSLLESLKEGVFDSITRQQETDGSGGSDSGDENDGSGESDSGDDLTEEQREKLKEYENDPKKILKTDLPVIRPAENRGLDYEQYLRVLLFFKEDPITVMRVLDLVQINVRKDYDGSFLIGEQSTGISTEMKINGRSFSLDKHY